MKKLLSIAFIAFLGFTANAQVNFGVKGGVNIASITGDETDGIKSNVGFHLGAVAEIEISELLSFQPELLFSTQGGKYEESEEILGVTVNYEEKVNLSYINVPLILKVYVSDGFAFEVGPQFGLLVGAKSKYDISGGGESESGDEDIKDFVSGLDLGAGFGASFKTESGLFFGARYVLGLSNINDFDGADEVNQKNSVIQASIGFLFN